MKRELHARLPAYKNPISGLTSKRSFANQREQFEETSPSMPSLPLAVTVGFSGPRSWYSYRDHSDLDPSVFQEAATEWLKNRLASLPAELRARSSFSYRDIPDRHWWRSCLHCGLPGFGNSPDHFPAATQRCLSGCPGFLLTRFHRYGETANHRIPGQPSRHPGACGFPCSGTPCPVRGDQYRTGQTERRPHRHGQAR